MSVGTSASFKICNATEVWKIETGLPAIPTFSQKLDDVLGHGGIQLGALTELIGLPGTGKTQLCLQLCSSVQIPNTFGGLNGEALYVDTNTNFTISRFREILAASLLRCKQIDPTMQINESDALKRLHYVNAMGLEKFCAFMHLLPSFLNDRPKIKLIVIDSIVFPYKVDISTQERTGLLFRQMAELQKLAVDNRIAVVLTNEMSTRVGLSSGSIVGSLGDAWAHRCNKRILLTAYNGHRVAVLLKSNNTSKGVAEFQITRDGIRDIN